MPEEIIETAELGDKIVAVLKTIFDPVPVDIYELGLIYDVFVNEDADIKILMTLTTPIVLWRKLYLRRLRIKSSL